jgi:exonuclease III
MNIVSWNIASGRKIKSGKEFDYQEEDLQYFINQLKKQNPDIICLQETQIDKDNIMAQKIADALNMEYVFNSSTHPSHINPKTRIGNAIISKYSFIENNEYRFVYPRFALQFKDGSKAKYHHKNLQIVRVNDLYIANTQLLPLRLFKYNYDQGLGKIYAKKVEKVLEKLSLPIILCGDFNFNEPREIFPKFFRKYNLHNALPNLPTRPRRKNKPDMKHDYIYNSDTFTLKDSGIVKTETDHYLCFAEFK